MPRTVYQRLASSPPYDAPQFNIRGKDHEEQFRVLQYGIGLDGLPVMLCILCTVVNALLALSLFNTSPQHGQDVITRDQLFRLRHPSQFIGFEKIIRPSQPIPREFNNDPFLVAHVQASHPDTVLRESYAAHMTGTGTVVPLTRKVVLSNDISTIFQFRAIDWGMENCEIKLELLSFKSWEGAMVGGDNITVDLFRLNSTMPLDEKTLTFANRPERISKLAEIDVRYDQGAHWHRHVSCPSGALLTFELACGDREENANCYSEWWQNGIHNVMVPEGETGNGKVKVITSRKNTAAEW